MANSRRKFECLGYQIMIRKRRFSADQQGVEWCYSVRCDPVQCYPCGDRSWTHSDERFDSVAAALDAFRNRADRWRAAEQTIPASEIRGIAHFAFLSQLMTRLTDEN